jgi:3-hydroxyisobutyrate dehydrogenase-like beta-hydroxyacid dehydrogenase
VKLKTIAIMGTGDMGHAVGRALIKEGFRVITALIGRSERSCKLAKLGGLEDVGSLENLIKKSDLFLSIIPPHEALKFASLSCNIMDKTGSETVYVDFNAIAPGTSKKIGEVFSKVGLTYIDGSIIGPPPGENVITRMYSSGNESETLLSLSGPNLKFLSLGSEIGRASALKMCYAALTKGTMALDLAALLAGKEMGVYEELKAEFINSQEAAYGRMEARLPWLSTESGRWSGEMDEIALSFDAVGLPAGFHLAASDIYKRLSNTSLAQEKPENKDINRTLDEALEIFHHELFSLPDDSD